MPTNTRAVEFPTAGVLPLDKERRRWERVTAIVLTGTRRDQDVSQQELAARLGWTRNMVANLESGRRSVRLSDYSNRLVLQYQRRNTAAEDYAVGQAR